MAEILKNDWFYEYFTGNAKFGFKIKDHFILSLIHILYDPAAGKKLALSDVFDPSQDYLTQVAQAAQEYLRRNEVLLKNMDESLFTQGTAPEEANYANFVLAPDKLLFFFGGGTIAPSGAGRCV